ncbi:MAG: bifunctional diguanylate cyclase/phosphodiesterase, partial [Oscillospiraceae bacterium]|nr:bifunctional diguanylate cyclase/phosphodiesterase [Oscillospiraceae bacterium]
IARSVDELAQKLQDQNKQIDDYRNIDPTTQLKNRYRLYEYLNDLAVSRDETRQRFALLFVDIDNFKWITETLGHKLGDEFLRTFGQRLRAVVPNVFRFSGDEFVVVTEFNEDYGVIEDVVKKLRMEMAEPIEILNDKLYAQFSVGVSVFPDDDTNLDMLLRDADIAVSRAKEKGKGRTAYFNPSFHQKLANKATIAQKLNKALENNEMFLKFQPIISVRNGDIHGFEVLVRWENDELGHVPPFTFVQIAEETGAIVEIGTWIFETGCRYLKRMNEYNSDIIMSINVSAVQLKKKDFIDKVVRTLEIFHIDPKNLQIEITETCLVDFAQGGNNVLQKLADLGISLALDDFGTGYSSFGYLKDMPIKTLKVDKSFVDEICNKNKDLQITGSIIDMVRNLGIKTVVEGVESIEQYNILSEMQCDYIQGFLMSKPLSANDAMEFVKSYDELHKPNRRSLEENSNRLAAEREEKEKQLEEKES